MRSLYTCLIVILTTLSHRADAQSLQPSTVRQVFAFEKGDSLQYYEQSDAAYPGCGLVCSAYRLNVIDSTYYNNALDTLTILFHSQIIHGDTASFASSCGTCRHGFWVPDYFALDAEKWIVTAMDSSIHYLLDTVYGTYCTWHYDSIYTSSSEYNGSKQNRNRFGRCIMDGWEEIYADSIGLTYKIESPEIKPIRTEELIYYHKANGKTWGNKYVYTAVKDITDESSIIIYPNPVSNSFTIKTDQYQDADFSLYDVLGQKVISRSLTERETEVRRSNLPSGIYHWHISSGERIMKAGKVVID